MQILKLDPRSREWHDVRNQSLTASTAAVFFVPENLKLLQKCAGDKGVHLDIQPLLDVGIDSFFDNTLWTLWADKAGSIPRFKGNADTERGVRHEADVVSLFESSQSILVEPEVTATCDADESWILASFDAVAPASSDTSVVAPNGFPVEAKCPAFPSRKKLWDSKKEGKPAIMGLPYYWCQVQHQIMVADAPYGWFVAAGIEEDPETKDVKVVYPLIEKVPRDERVLKAYKAAIKFYYDTFLYPYEEPPKLPSDQRLLDDLARKAEFDRAVTDGDINLAVDLYLDLVKKEKELEIQRKALEKKVVLVASGLKSEGANVIRLADRLDVTFGESLSVSWQKVAQELAKLGGLTDIPADLVASCTSKPRQTVKFKEVA